MKLRIDPRNLILRLFSALIFFSATNIFGISALLRIPDTVWITIRMICLLACVVLYLHNRAGRKVDVGWTLILGWCGIIILLTLAHGKNIAYAINYLSRDFLIASFLFLFLRDRRSIQVILHTWIAIICCLLLVDILSFFRYPHGMGGGGMYGWGTWFLGYKTARYTLLLPLLTMICYESYLQKDGLTWKEYAVICLVLLDCILTSTTAGTLATALFLGFIILIQLHSPSEQSVSRRIYRLLDTKRMFVIYAALFVVIVVIQETPFITYILHNVFGKRSDISNRVYIWNRCLQVFRTSPVFGQGYLKQEEYVVLTGFRGGTSAHNLILSILVTSGLTGLIYFIFMQAFFLTKRDHAYYHEESVLVVSIMMSFIVGITSSTMFSTAFNFLPHVLLCTRYAHRRA